MNTVPSLISTLCPMKKMAVGLNFFFTTNWFTIFFQNGKHYKTSNENYKHHESWGKVERGITRTFQGTLFLILLCKLNRPVEFRNHIFLTTLSRKLCSFNPTNNVYFGKETKKNRCPCNYLGNGS